MGKYTELWNKKKEESLEFESSKSSRSNLPKLNWFYPNRAVKASEKGTYMVRVLPLEGKDTWFYEFKKHSIKFDSWKNCLCLETEGKDGKKLANCPICDFLYKYEDELEGNDNVKNFRKKDTYGLLVFDYATKSILRYELNYYGFRDILASIVANEDEDFESLIDTEGFNLHFAKDEESGYSKIVGVNAGKKTIEEIKEILGIDKLPNVIDYTLDYGVDGTTKTLNGYLQLAEKHRMFPEVFGSSSSKRSVSMDDDIPIGPKKKTKETEVLEEDIEIDTDIDLSEELEDIKPKSEKTKSKVKEDKKESVKPTKTTVIEDDELNAILEDL